MDYTECGALAKVTDHFNEATAKQYRDAAVQELTAAGATFPIKVQYPYNPAVVDWDKQCQVFKQQVEAEICPRQQLHQSAQRLHRRYQKHLLPDGHGCGLPDRQPERHRQQTAKKLLVLLHKLPSSPACYKV